MKPRLAKLRPSRKGRRFLGGTWESQLAFYRRELLLPVIEPSILEREGGNEVYFVHSPTTGHLKIGVSRNADERLATLQAHCPVQLILLRTAPGGVWLEYLLHQMFSDLRLHGEWFTATNEILLYAQMATR